MICFGCVLGEPKLRARESLAERSGRTRKYTDPICSRCDSLSYFFDLFGNPSESKNTQRWVAPILLHPWLEIDSRKPAADSHGISRMRAKKYVSPVHGWLIAWHLETTRLEWRNDDRSLGIRSVFFRFLSGILSQCSACRILSHLCIETIASAVGSALR